MPRDWQVRVADMLQAADRIREFTRGLDLDGFRADVRTIQAVTYNLLIVGESAGHLPAAVLERYPAIPWHRVRGIRNVIVHEYFDVRPDVIWETAQSDIPALVEVLNRMLGEAGP
ncbi:DUF86 domain-containing protein [Myxococcota bacterium]|nr:DUF86 domain-containing protein [Myxococcota bacterium]